MMTHQIQKQQQTYQQFQSQIIAISDVQPLKGQPKEPLPFMQFQQKQPDFYQFPHTTLRRSYLILKQSCYSLGQYSFRPRRKRQFMLIQTGPLQYASMQGKQYHHQTKRVDFSLILRPIQLLYPALPLFFQQLRCIHTSQRQELRRQWVGYWGIQNEWRRYCPLRYLCKYGLNR